MPVIGGVACVFVKPLIVNGARPRVEVWQDAGIDGYGSRVLGLGNSEFRFLAVYYGSNTQALAWLRLMEGLAGSVVNIVDDWSITWPHMQIVQLVGPQTSVAIGPGWTTRAQIFVEGVRIA